MARDGMPPQQATRRGVDAFWSGGEPRGGSVLVKWQTLIATLVLGLALGFAGGFWSGARDALGHCPAEDSCVIDYHRGQWRIADTEAEVLEVQRDRLVLLEEMRSSGRFGD